MISNILSYDSPPEDFAAGLEVAGCFCEFQSKFLLLKRHPNKDYGNTWGIPAGKLEPNEDPSTAVKREVFEETGLVILQPQKIATLYHRLPDLDFIFHLYYTPIHEIPKIDLSLEEHVENRWITIEEAYSLPLIPGANNALAALKTFLVG